MDDPHFKKTIEFAGRGFALDLRTAHDLFSSHEVDRGTRLLLNSLNSPEFEGAASVLDLGCGYGPLGLALKALRPSRTVDLVDRDALAVEYARGNADLSKLDVSVYGSLGYDDVSKRDFDLIVSNVPGKAGADVIDHLIRDSAYFLAPHGIVAIVVVSALAATVKELLAGAEILNRDSRGGHTYFHYRPVRPEGEYERAFDRGVYARGATPVRVAGMDMEVLTAHGLGDFDSIGYETGLLLEAVGSLDCKVVGAAFSNPGQGHVPLLAFKHLFPDEIHLFDRDLLALRQTQMNLTQVGAQAELAHSSRPVGSGEFDLVVLHLREKEPSAVSSSHAATLFGALRAGGTMVAGGSSTEITRIAPKIEAAGGRLASRRKKKGHSVIVATKVGGDRLRPR